MLLVFFDLLQEFRSDEKYKDKISSNFIKKVILSMGICGKTLYDNICKILENKNDLSIFENFLECFNPILEIGNKNLSSKYKFLLYLVKNHTTQAISMENYKVFCSLIKGKTVYQENICTKLNNNIVESFKTKYPKEYNKNFKYYQLSSILEYLIDNK